MQDHDSDARNGSDDKGEETSGHISGTGWWRSDIFEMAASHLGGIIDNGGSEVSPLND
jgi:hypothetical protein